MNKEYLPSKEFVIKVVVIIILATGVFVISKLVSFIKNKANSSNTPFALSIIQSTEKDSNKNGIPDWEEKLWGLNPNKKGSENKEFILSRRKALNPNVDLSSYEETLTESDTLSREFFAVIMALQETGDLDEETIQVISGAASEEIVAKPIPDAYKIDILNIVTDTPENVSKYYSDFKNLISKYENRNIGDELSFIIQGISYNDPQVLLVAETVAVAYREFSEELIEISVPKMMADLHLSIANNYEKNFKTTYGLSQFFSNPIIATRSIANYKKYNDSLAIDLKLLSYIFNTE